ncbi:histidine kinase [Paraflavitalea soli]|uniref:Histidine kinase n=1 Tax=Paraflavitalea soli TaxID=2315862 RepID=A0A3B7MX75_9BACT|nr:sensor histidine kinase [Paraflavitalea soli]AXY76285.1 histidine kinase [Paraflavitalea soli]
MCQQFLLLLLLSMTSWLNLPAQQPSLYFDRLTMQNGLSHNKVNCIIRDRRGFMWFGTNDGLNRYDGHNFDVFQYKPGDSTTISGNIIHDILEDEQGVLWIATADGGLSRYDHKQPPRRQFKQYRHLPGDSHSIPVNILNKLLLDTQGYLWIGTSGVGLLRFDRVMEKFTLPIAHDTRTILDLEMDKAGMSKVPFSFNNDEISCFTTDIKGRLWMGSRFGGLHIYDKASGRLYHYGYDAAREGTIADNHINSLYTDSNGVVWIGTDRGVSIHRPAQQQFEQTFLPAAGGGTARDITIYDFYERDGNLWIGTSEGIYIREPGNNKLHFRPVLYKGERLGVTHFFEDVDGTLYLGTDHSLFRCDVSTLRVRLLPDTEKDLVAKRWISRHDTLKNVIDCYKPGSISSNDVSDLKEDGAGNLWVSTYGGGLHYFDRTRRMFTHIPASNNLLEGLQLDPKGNVWMISNGNLHKYDPGTKSFTSFDLPDIEKAGGVRGNIFRDRKGWLYVAGNNYFIAFNPREVQDTRRIPQVFFTDFKIFNESYNDLLQQDKINLRYDQNYFTVTFAAPDLSVGRNTHYAYILEGRDKEWIDIGTRTAQEFSNLEAKDYVLKVRATDNAGLWNEKVATIHITIIPPFWQRWWFYGLCALTMGLLIYSIYRYRFDQLLKQQAIRNKIAQDLHDNVGSTLSSISVYSQVAKIYHQQERQDDLHQTLEKISETSGEMISEMNDIVWAINPRHDSMDTILQRMESFARPLLASKGIVFHFEVEPGIKQVNLEMTRRKNFYLIFKEAVNNALKYADCRNLWVRIGLRHHQLELEVKDGGVGFDREKVRMYASQSLSGNGLRNMEMRAAEMKGAWTIESEPGKGTVVQLRFPVG